MGLLSSKNRSIKYLLCMIDVFTKYDWVKPLKDKKCKTVLNGFVEIVNEYKRQLNKLWVYKGRKFYNNHVQKWLENYNILTYSTNTSREIYKNFQG